jgi:zinc transporter, ZIP family
VPNLIYAFIPVIAVLIGAMAAVWRRPGASLVSAVQHLAAGVVFAAAASEILPQVKHEGSLWATGIGGTLGVIVMLSVKSLEGRWKGPIGMASAIGIDIFIDGLVLGLAFLAGEKAGLLLTIALTLEVLFLGLTVTAELGETIRSRAKIVAISVALALLLPIGTLAATPVALLSAPVIAGFLTFGLIALLYLVTEELLVEAHEQPDSPIITAMFFVGFLGLLMIEEMLG